MKKTTTHLNRIFVKILFSFFSFLIFGKNITAQIQIVQNGSFVNSSSSWSISTYSGIFNLQSYNTPNYGVLLVKPDGDYQLGVGANIVQNITLPPNTINATLKFNQRISTQETSIDVMDNLYVRIKKNDGNSIVVSSQSNHNSSTSWSQKTIDLSNYLPTGILNIEFYAVENGNGYGTKWRIDDVELLVTSTNPVCSYTFNPSSNPNVPASGGNFTVNASTQTGCSVAAATSNVNWITVFGYPVVTSAVNVPYSVAPNTSTTPRIGIIAISTGTYMITQAGATSTPCIYSLSSNSHIIPSSGGSNSFSVNVTGGCNYQAIASSSNVIITSGSSGSNGGQIQYNVTANNSTSAQVYTINVNGQVHTINQSATSINNYTITTSSNNNTFGVTGGGGNILPGQSCTISATSNFGYLFKQWLKNGVPFSFNSNYTFTPTSSANYVAEFIINTQIQFSVNTNSLPSNGGFVTQNGGSLYVFNDPVILTAVPSNGFVFQSFTIGGNVVSTNPVYTFNITSNTAVIANFIAQSQSPDYKLPFPIGKTYKCTQGNNGALSHFNDDLYAFDFNLSLGDKFTSMRGGVVVKVVQNFDDYNCTSGGLCKSNFNYILIKGVDGKYDWYMHMTKNGSLVSVGDNVYQGQIIGKAGSSGWSTAAHLHVKTSLTSAYTSSPMRFCDVSSDNGVPQTGKSYTSKQCSAGAATNNNIIQVNPNPNNGNFAVAINSSLYEQAKICVLNSQGLEYDCKNENLFIGNNNISISISNINSGIYFIRIKTATFTKVVSFIKQ